MDNQNLKQKKLKIILLKGGLRYLEEIRDMVEQRMESVESEIDSLTDEIRLGREASE
jgi:hypothetical protein